MNHAAPVSHVEESAILGQEDLAPQRRVADSVAAWAGTDRATADRAPADPAATLRRRGNGAAGPAIHRRMPGSLR